MEKDHLTQELNSAREELVEVLSRSSSQRVASVRSTAEAALEESPEAEAEEEEEEEAAEAEAEGEGEAEAEMIEDEVAEEEELAEEEKTVVDDPITATGTAKGSRTSSVLSSFDPSHPRVLRRQVDDLQSQVRDLQEAHEVAGRFVSARAARPELWSGDSSDQLMLRAELEILKREVDALRERNRTIMGPGQIAAEEMEKRRRQERTKESARNPLAEYMSPCTSLYRARETSPPPRPNPWDSFGRRSPYHQASPRREGETCSDKDDVLKLRSLRLRL